MKSIKLNEQKQVQVEEVQENQTQVETKPNENVEERRNPLAPSTREFKTPSGKTFVHGMAMSRHLNIN
ncbi:hypothetical protein IGI01_02390 [Bacillus thuringiensis]|nr:hypothetical protein [Bacillus thuringiensis]